MTDCTGEGCTRHYRGRWFGFGPIQDDETVIYAVFDNTPISSKRLIENSFENNKLKKNNQSLARASFVTKSQFDKKIVRRDATSKGPLVGVAVAGVADIRALRADVKLNAGTRSFQAIYVLDRVERGDCAGHGTMGYEWTGDLTISQTQLATIRKKIRYDLANVFSPIADATARQWPPYFRVLSGRIASIRRVVRKVILRIAGKTPDK
jgi:hypothetical protein